jgi:hypothetical protein
MEKLELKNGTIALVRKTGDELLALFTGFDEDRINQQPAEDKWSAAQVAEHLTRSNMAIALAMLKPGEKATRSPDERLGELASIFLSFENKFQSPEFILPTRTHYSREQVLQEFKTSLERIEEDGEKADLTEIVHHKAFGIVTKLELLHFASYHMERHARQVRSIMQAVNK